MTQKILWSIDSGCLIGMQVEKPEEGKTYYKTIKTVYGPARCAPISIYNYDWTDTPHETIRTRVANSKQMVSIYQNDAAKWQAQLARADEIMTETEGKVS